MKTYISISEVFRKKRLLVAVIILYLASSSLGTLFAQENSSLVEKLKTITYNAGATGREYRVFYHENGYYEGATINFRNLWSYSGNGGFSHWYENYYVNGEFVEDTKGDYYHDVISNFSLRLELYHGKNESHKIVDATYNIKCIRLSFNLPSQWCLSSGNINLRDYVFGSTGLYV